MMALPPPRQRQPSRRSHSKEARCPSRFRSPSTARTVTADVDPRTLLVDFLRNELGAHGHARRLRHRPVRRLHRASRRQRGQGVHDPRRAGERRRGRDDRRSRRRRRHDASDAGGVQGMPRPAMRLLHAGNGDERDRPRAIAIRRRRSRRSARSSRATSAAAPAITTSSRRCSRAPPRWASTEDAMGATEQGVIGASVRRKEDYRFLTGSGQYTDDVNPPNHVHAYFLRSPHAHAKIRKIDTDEGEGGARRRRRSSPAPISTGVNGLPCGWLITGTDGKPMNEPPHPVLAQGKVRYVGDQVALVIAETPDQAKDAAELDRRRLRRAARGRQLRRRAEAGRAADPRRRARATSATRGRSATRRRSMPRSPRPRTCRSSTSSTTGSSPTRSSRAPPSRRTAAPTTATRSTSRTRIRTSSAC